MLSLGRREGEFIDIFVGGRHIEIKVSRVFKNNQVRLAFDADKDIIILRREVTAKALPKIPSERVNHE